MNSRYLELDGNQWIARSAYIPVTERPNFQYVKEESYRDNIRGVSDHVQRKVKVKPEKYQVKESRKYTVDSSKMNSGIKTSVKQVQNKKKLAIEMPKEVKKKPKMLKSIDNTSDKVKMEIFLEKVKTGVLMTKVRVGKRVRWQNVKPEKQALRYHPAITKRQSVLTAVATMKTHKTLHITLTKDESRRYKGGDLLEETKKPKPKPSIAHQQVICYQVNNNMYGAGPSTSAHCIEDNSEYTSSSSFYDSSAYSTDES